MANTNAVNQAIARLVAAGGGAGGGTAPTSRKSQLKQRILMDEIQKAMPPHISNAIAKEALASQVVKKYKSFYSTVRFQFVPSSPSAGVTTYTLKSTTNMVRAFSYGIGDDMVNAGFSQSLTGYGAATKAETNLISKNDTNGAVVKVTGISLYLSETSDPALAKLVWANTFVDTTLDGVSEYLLIGRMGRIPAAGGLYGNGDSPVTTPALGAGMAQVSHVSNGMPTADNYHKLGEPIWWHPASKTDSKFQVRFQVVRDLTVTAAARAAGAGVTAYTPPANLGDPGTFVDVVVYLRAIEFTKRSKQQ